MSHLVEIENPGHEELIFLCDCSDGDYLRITWDDVDSNWRYLWVEAWSHTPGFWKRLAGCWRILTGRSWQHSEIVLNHEVLDQLRSFIDRKQAHL